MIGFIHNRITTDKPLLPVIQLKISDYSRVGFIAIPGFIYKSFQITGFHKKSNVPIRVISIMNHCNTLENPLASTRNRQYNSN